MEKEHPNYAENCQGLLPGSSAYSVRAEIPFDLHRYDDGWHVYWKNPPNGQIGRWLQTRVQLTAFLAGNWRLGTALMSPWKEGVMFRRPLRRRR